MPFVEVTTRKPLSKETKVSLANRLSTAVSEIEVGKVTDGVRSVDWMWFRVLPEDDWAVGGKFGGEYVKGRLMCLAHVIAPEALMTTGLQAKAIADITRILREELGADPQDDGTGIFVIVSEVPDTKWGAGGEPMPLPKLLGIMDGDVSDERKAGMRAHYEGVDKMKEAFGIPK